MNDTLPGPIPTGSDRYYTDRLADFVERFPDATPPTYYAEIGDKCLHQFRRTEPDLSDEGQQWLQRTLVDLQVRMERRRSADPAAFGRLEHDDAAFHDVAYEMHSEAYLASGIGELSVSDLWKIARTPDVSVLLTADGVKEIMEVLAGIGEDRVRSGHSLLGRLKKFARLPGR